MTHAGEEAALFRQCPAVRYDTEGVHLQAVVVVEAQRLMLYHTLVQLKATPLQPLTAAGMAGIQNRHIGLFRHLIDSREQRSEVFLGVDILLTVSRQPLLSEFSEL